MLGLGGKVLAPCRRRQDANGSGIMKRLNELRAHWSSVEARRILDLFAADTDRPKEFSLEADGLLFDYSKTNLDSNERAKLLGLAASRNLKDRIEQMFQGERINQSENRPVLHTALRSFGDQGVFVDGFDVVRDSRNTLSKMCSLADQVRQGAMSTGAGDRFTDVINIGIGGSDLGPAMAVEALQPYADGPTVHYVSNIDGSQIDGTIRRLNPATTMVIVVSKTFRTIETLTNARTARRWISDALGEGAIRERFVGVSSNVNETSSFGIDPQLVFEFGDWVGGRYSVWGPVGLSLMLAIGPGRFREFLSGAGTMDRHFRSSPLNRNMPVLLGLVGLWHNQVCGHASRAILPYDQRLSRFPAYLQQLEMESNGKSVKLDGSRLSEHSAPIVWGEPGTNGQHAFHQMLHQGTRIVPCEFLVAAEGHERDLTNHHDILVANCLAQSQALMAGTAPPTGESVRGSSDGVEVHRHCPGNRPSTMLLYRRLTPFVLGQLIALYEHRVFVEGTILRINSFDQWGVELGKQLATKLNVAVADGAAPPGTDGSTEMLLEFIHKCRQPRDRAD